MKTIQKTMLGLWLVLLFSVPGISRADDNINTNTADSSAVAISSGGAGGRGGAGGTGIGVGGAGGNATGGAAEGGDATGGSALSESQGGSINGGLSPVAGVNFQYSPTSLSTSNYTQPKVQHATGASGFVPTPGVMQEFTINSDAAKAANLLDVYAGFACGPKAYTSGKFEVTEIELSNTDGDADVDVSVVFSPRPGFVKNDTDIQPAAAFSVYHKNMLWGQKFTCLGIVDVNPDDVQQRLGPSVLENAAGAVGSSSLFGHYKNIVLMYTKDSVQLRSGSASSVETKGFTISGSGTPGVSGFAQGAIGWGKTDGALVHTDVVAFKALALAIDPNGRFLPSYDQFELGILSNIADQKKVLSGSAPVPLGAQVVGAGQR